MFKPKPYFLIIRSTENVWAITEQSKRPTILIFNRNSKRNGHKVCFALSSIFVKIRVFVLHRSIFFQFLAQKVRYFCDA